MTADLCGKFQCLTYNALGPLSLSGNPINFRRLSADKYRSNESRVASFASVMGKILLRIYLKKIQEDHSANFRCTYTRVEINFSSSGYLHYKRHQLLVESALNYQVIISETFNRIRAALMLDDNNFRECSSIAITNERYNVL